MRGAKLTISETDRGGLRVVHWWPFPESGAADAAPSRAVSPRTAENELAATLA